MDNGHADLQRELFGGSVVAQEELCKALNVKVGTLRQWHLPSCRLGGRTLYRTSDVQRHLSKRFERRPARSKKNAPAVTASQKKNAGP